MAEPDTPRATDAPPHLGRADAGIVVDRPRIVERRRHDPAAYSIGDEAAIEFGPGLLRFLSLGDSSGWTIGIGGAFEWTIPVGAAGTAAYAVLEPPGFDGVNTWTGVTNTIRWHRACAADETLIATCRIAALTRLADTPYKVWSRERGDLIVEGRFLFASVASDAEGHFTMLPRRRPGDPVPSRERGARERADHPPAPALDAEPPLAHDDASHDLERLPAWSPSVPDRRERGEPPAPPLLSLRAPRLLRTRRAADGRRTWEWLFPRDLLLLLGHPIGGGKEPLGRRHHPYGRILEGMAIHAARAIGGGAPRTLTVEWWSPTRADHDFRIRSHDVATEGESRVTRHDIYEGERPVGCARVETAPPSASSEFPR